MAQVNQSKLADAIKQTTDLPDYINEVSQKTLMKKVETPRAYIIIIVAYAEDLITKLLKSRLVVPLNSHSDELFSEQGPLYNFGAKLRLAYRMGLISQEMYWTLDRLRKLRDKCAHTHSEVSYEQPSTKDIIAEIHRRLSPHHHAANSAEKFQEIVTGVLIMLWNYYNNSVSGLSAAQKEIIFR